MCPSKAAARKPAPSDAEPGLRERKAAATRLSIGRGLATRLATRPLADITVDELAAEAGVSRVTFFNYFATKELAFDYAITCWLYEVHAAARKRGLRGRRAIEHLFESMGEFIQESPVRARQMIGHFAMRPDGNPMPVITRTERALLVPDVEPDDEPLWLGGLLMRAVDEAVRDGELVTKSSTYEIGHLLGSLYTGSAIIGHSRPDQDWRRLYRHHVRWALDGASGDVSAPKKPARGSASKRGKK